MVIAPVTAGAGTGDVELNCDDTWLETDPLDCADELSDDSDETACAAMCML